MMIDKFGWYWFLSGKEDLIDDKKCGKWMHFFNDQDFAIKMCQRAIDENACYECKCTNMKSQQSNEGVICFYLNGDDVENHKRIIKFMIENDLIRKTKAGKFYNNSFKFDYQTHAGEYDSDFEGKIKLEDFIDLNTGEWIHE